MTQLVQSLVRLIGSAQPNGDGTYRVTFQLQISHPVQSSERATYDDSGDFVEGTVAGNAVFSENRLQVPRTIRDSLSLMATGEKSCVRYQIERACTVLEGEIERFTFPTGQCTRHALEANLLNYFIELSTEPHEG